MRLQRNRVVAEWTGRLAEVPADRDALDEVGRTVLFGRETVMRKFGALLPVPETEADWEEMPWLMGQGGGLIHDGRPAAEIVQAMMDEAGRVLGRFGGY